MARKSAICAFKPYLIRFCGLSWVVVNNRVSPWKVRQTVKLSSMIVSRDDQRRVYRLGVVSASVWIGLVYRMEGFLINKL
jgi:hypothetical protein